VNEKLLSLAGFLAAVAGIVYLALTRQLLGSGPVTLAVQAAAALLMIWARVTFGRRSFHATANPTAGGLVTSGPYRYWRHPIYAAILYFTWAGVLSHLSTGSIAAALVITAGLGVRMFLEEKLLRREYPEYREYSARTKRVLPFLF
jgi:protein-S-isoprenylcysteine O-methyltransferase Ste14